MKPICKYCKHMRQSGFTCKVCNKDKKIDCVGNWHYTKCTYKNEGFKCKDFEPKLIHRRKYKGATNGNNE